MLEVKNLDLSVAGRSLALGLSFVVRPGETLCLSGRGTTVLLRALLGCWPLDNGYVTVDGEPLTPLSAPAFRAMIGYVPQQLPRTDLPVSELVTLPFLLRGCKDVAFSKRRLMEHWDRLALEHSLYGRSAASLTEGELRRVLLSVAGQLGKGILLLDQPLAGVEEALCGQVARYVDYLAGQGAAVVAATGHEALQTIPHRELTLNTFS